MQLGNIVNFGYRYKLVYRDCKLSYSAYLYTFDAFCAVALEDEVTEENRYEGFQDACNNGIVFW